MNDLDKLMDAWERIGDISNHNALFDATRLIKAQDALDLADSTLLLAAASTGYNMLLAELVAKYCENGND